MPIPPASFLKVARCLHGLPRSAFTESVFLWRRLSQQVLDEVVPAFAHPERALTETVAAVREDVHVKVLVGIHQVLDDQLVGTSLPD